MCLSLKKIINKYFFFRNVADKCIPAAAPSSDSENVDNVSQVSHEALGLRDSEHQYVNASLYTGLTNALNLSHRL